MSIVYLYIYKEVKIMKEIINDKIQLKAEKNIAVLKRTFKG